MVEAVGAPRKDRRHRDRRQGARVEKRDRKTGIEPLKRGLRAYRVQAAGGRYAFSFRDADYQPVGRIGGEVAAEFFPTDPP